MIRFTAVLSKGLAQVPDTYLVFDECSFLPSLSTSEDLKKNTILDVCEGCRYNTLCY